MARAVACLRAIVWTLKQEKVPCRPSCQSTHQFVCLVVALRIEGQEGITLVELKVADDVFHAKLLPPLDVVCIHFLCLAEIMLARSEEAAHIVFVCTRLSSASCFSRSWLGDFAGSNSLPCSGLSRPELLSKL